MIAQISIGDVNVMIDDDSLEQLNKVLAQVNVCEQKQVDGEWKYVPIAGKRARFVPEFALRRCYFKV